MSEKMTTSEPTTGEIVRALRDCLNVGCEECILHETEITPECKSHYCGAPTKLADLVESLQRETEPEMYRGYDAGRLEMAYELIAGAGITPDDLKKCVWNFELAAKIYAEELRRSVGEATLKLINGGMIEIELLNLPNHEPKGDEARCD